ncbi:MAG: hypothetical protein AB8G15_01465 [Saprospiraceae bacterium]
MPELILKERIVKLIDELIISIELRVKLNEAIVDMKDIALASNLDKDLSNEAFLQNLQFEEGNANQVVIECQETLMKLNLLKKNLSLMDESSLLYLFNHYSKFSLAEFQDKLRSKLVVAS